MQIDKHIPIPPAPGAKKPDPLPKMMQVGDSVLFPGESTKGTIYQRCNLCAVQRGWRAEGRTLPEGLRVWRVA